MELIVIAHLVSIENEMDTFDKKARFFNFVNNVNQPEIQLCNEPGM